VVKYLTWESMKKRYKYIVVFCSFIVGIALIAIAYLEKDDHIVIDTETVSVIRRGPIYSKTVWREFRPGDTLSTKENGAYILWDTSMPVTWIYGIVSDSGTIEIWYE